MQKKKEKEIQERKKEINEKHIEFYDKTLSILEFILSLHHSCQATSRATSRAEQQIPQFFAQLRTKTSKTIAHTENILLTNATKQPIY